MLLYAVYCAVTTLTTVASDTVANSDVYKNHNMLKKKKNFQLFYIFLPITEWK